MAGLALAAALGSQPALACGNVLVAGARCGALLVDVGIVAIGACERAGHGFRRRRANMRQRHEGDAGQQAEKETAVNSPLPKFP